MVTRYVEEQLALGFMSVADITEEALYYGECDGAAPDEVEAFVAEAVRAYGRMLASRSDSDAERLDRAFRRLDAAGILARHHYGCTRTDAAGALEGELRAAEAMGRSMRGFVHYTMQDADLLLEGELCLAWGPIPMPGQTRAALLDGAGVIGDEIVAALRDEGLDATWDGNPHTVIGLRGIDWKAPRDPESGAPVLREGELLEPVYAQPAPPERYEVTAADEWLIRVTYVALEGIVAHANLLRLDERMGEGSYRAGPVPPGDVHSDEVLGFDFKPLALSPVGGRQARFDVQAVTMSLLLGQTWRQAVEGAHGVVFCASSRQALLEGMDLLDELRLPPLVVQLDGDWSDADREAARERCGDRPIVESRVVADGSGTFDVVKAIAKLTLTDLKRYVGDDGPGGGPTGGDGGGSGSTARAGASERESTRLPTKPWWKLWG